MPVVALGGGVGGTGSPPPQNKKYSSNWWLPATFLVSAVYSLMSLVLPVQVNAIRGRVRVTGMSADTLLDATDDLYW